MPQPHPDSYYAATANDFPALPALAEDMTVDVCIVGAGLTGLSAAIELAGAGLTVAVLEAEQVGWGASGRNGGEVIPGIGPGMQATDKIAGREDSRALWEMTLESIELIKHRIEKFSINCDFKPGYVEAAAKPSHFKALQEEQKFHQDAYGYDGLTLHSEKELSEMLGSERFFGGLSYRDSAHLHPLNLTRGYASAALNLGAKIFEGTRVSQINPDGASYRVITPNGVVKADHVLMACNAYIDELHSPTRSRIMPTGSFILATEPLDEDRFGPVIPVDMCVCDTNFVLDYFRLSADRRMLFGGLVSYSTLPPPKLADRMHRRMIRTFPQLEDAASAYIWAGLLAVTVNRMPGLGRTESGIYYAQGYSGHGLALTSIAGKVIAEAMRGTADRFDVFARLPQHKFRGGRAFRVPLLVTAMAYQRIRDLVV